MTLDEPKLDPAPSDHKRAALVAASAGRHSGVDTMRPLPVGFERVLSWYSREDREHVERHVRLCELLADALELSTEEHRTLACASVLHEFGRIGFDYALRDELVALAERKGCVDLLSRTELIQRRLVPDWPAPEDVVAAIELALGDALSQTQRRNLEILFAHDQLTVENVLERRTAIPFDVDGPLRVLRGFVSLQERRDPGAGDADLLLALALAGADQIEITNSRRRWRRSRRRGRSWLEIHLTDEAVAGRDATLPSLHRHLVRQTDGRVRPYGERVYELVLGLFLDPPATLVAALADARDAPVPAAEWAAVERYAATPMPALHRPSCNGSS